MVNGVSFYRDSDLPFFELKICDTAELSYKRHCHDEYSLGFVDCGDSSFWYEGKVAEVRSRAMVLLPPNLIHACNPAQQSQWRYKMLFIDANWVQGFMASRPRLPVDTPVIRYLSDGGACQTVTQIFDSFTGNATPLEKETNIVKIFQWMLQCESQYDDTGYPKEQPKLELIREYLQQNFLEKVALDQLEQVSELNKFHLIRLFKEWFKVPPHAYQILLRVNYARKELRRQRAVAEVALDAGFYDQSHFSKVFKSHMGVTPERYQKDKN